MTRERPISITVLVQTKNEEIGIEACLKAWIPHFDEVIVVDSISGDNTKAIAQELGVEVVDFAWDGKYPKKKQWQLDNLDTRNTWILFIDADEYPTGQLIDELSILFDRAAPRREAAFDIKLDYKFAGKTLRHGHVVVKRALVNRNLVQFPEIDDLDIPGMGELEGHYQPKAYGVVGSLNGRILHDDRDPIRTWFERHNRYSDWEAHLHARHSARIDTRNARSFQGRLFDYAPFKPFLFFTYSYFLKKGVLDGRAGFDYAMALSMYYWQIDLKIRELREWKR